MRPLVIIVATILLDGLLAVVNFYVAGQTDSRAVLSQAVYTTTDLLGGALLLWGFYASQRPPDYTHPFGRGKERYFWAFTSSLVTFTIAGFVVVASGLGQVFAPATVTNLPSAVLVVGATLGASLIGILVTLRELRAEQQTLEMLLESSHQGLKAIFYQDVVSVFGSIVAFGGILVVYRTHDYVADGLTALIVGVILVGTGFVLAAESRVLLVGKAIPMHEARLIFSLAEQDPRVRSVRSLQTMQLGPEEVLVALKVNFQDGLNTDQIESTIDQLSASLRQMHPTFRHILIEPES